VVIAHVAAHTERIRLGAGGVMLPNHAPLTIAEQYGTLETLHPGRIDLGLGRAPGSDQATMRALRRGPEAAESFPRDVLELQGYLSGDTLIPGVHAIPGRATNVPLYILGSSLFGASLAAALGLPYGFASHFAPALLHDAIALYRERFEPSKQLDHPYVIAGVNVIAADTDDDAQEQLHITKRARVRNLFSRGGRRLTDGEAEQVLQSPQAAHVEQMMRFTAVGTGPTVRAFLDSFIDETGADELMVVHTAPAIGLRLRSIELLAEAAQLSP
jgi:luciferase family oxidoreductase group 1